MVPRRVRQQPRRALGREIGRAHERLVHVLDIERIDV
jgi:hypothetical protein